MADVGCGLGASTILMAQAYPRSRFVGFDVHPGSIDLARQRAREARVEDRVRFEVAKATDYPGKGYDLVATSTRSTTWPTRSAPPGTSARRFRAPERG